MNPNINCDEFEPLVSALIDNELTDQERIDVENHLKCCSSCENMLHEFGQVDSAIESLGFEGNEHSSGNVETFVVTRKKPALKDWLSVWRLGPVGVVAALLIGLFLVTAQSTPEVTAEQLTPERFVKPMTELNRINLQQHRDQELMLRTLGMDLRTLKLELRQLESAQPEDRDRLEKQIETMLQRVRSFENVDDA